MVDIHCHILPGVDDGPKAMDESLAMLRIAEADGIRTIVATPHFGGRFDEPPPDVIRALVERVNARAAGEGLRITVLPGCEASLDLELPAKTEAGRVVTFGGDRRYLLVEVAAEPIPLYALEVSFQLRVMGTQPVLAHAERLAATKAGLGFVRRFVEQGGLVQINADAMGGQVGWQMRRLCQRLVKEGLVHAIATDAHSPTFRPPVLTACLRGFPKPMRPTVTTTYCSLQGVG
jgi:protein-tyrosine phosphatase